MAPQEQHSVAIAKDPARQIKAVETASEVLWALHIHGPIGVSELAEHLEHSKSTVHAHLQSLFATGLVTRVDGKYRMGLLSLNYGMTAKRQVPANDIARRQVENLATTTGEQATYHVREHGYAVLLHRADGAKAIRTDGVPGNRLQMHSTAQGKALLANLHPSVVEMILAEQRFWNHTDRTITDLSVLRTNLAEARLRGVAFGDGERIREVRTVAVPVRNEDEDVLGALGIRGPVSRLRGQYFRDELPRALQAAAETIRVEHAQNQI